MLFREFSIKPKITFIDNPSDYLCIEFCFYFCYTYFYIYFILLLKAVLAMPIKIPDTLPALKVLESENIFVMTDERAMHQDIRPLRILILNLMPTKIETETQLLRLLGNSPLQVEIDLMQTATHTSKNTPLDHLLNFYHFFDDIKHKSYDGMIITGAPVELMPFESVDYWDELCTVMDWARKHVFSTFYICWGAQAALYYHYGVQKYTLSQKLSGIYRHDVLDMRHPLVRGFDKNFLAPHSRHTDIRLDDLTCAESLQLLATSPEAGAYIIASHDGRQIFITGHSEYDQYTLAKEYFRDVEKGIDPKVPKNYFINDNPDTVPPLTWRSHASLLFTNWLNYYVYQRTPYDLSQLL